MVLQSSEVPKYTYMHTYALCCELFQAMNKRGRLGVRSKYVDVLNPSGTGGGAPSAPPPGPLLGPTGPLPASTFLPQQPTPGKFYTFSPLKVAIYYNYSLGSEKSTRQVKIKLASQMQVL